MHGSLPQRPATTGRIYLSPPDMGPDERSALIEAFDSGWVSTVGPALTTLEEQLSALTGLAGAVALSSGTAALHLALLAAGVGPGDVVLTSTFTFAATANAICYVGATPVFVDSDTTSWNLDPGLLDEALETCRRRGRPAKAVLMVDLYGQCADADPIAEACRRHGAVLIEDSAEALGATYRGRPAGTLGDIGVFSFNGNKIATTGGGGALVTADAAVAARVRHLATQAREPVTHYEHLEVGYNYRMPNLAAAIGTAQLRRLPAMIDRRLGINRAYRELLGGIEGLSFMPVPDWSGWNGWLSCIVLDGPGDADRVCRALAEVDVESRPLWKPMHLQPVFAGAERFGGGVSERLFAHGLCLPSGSTLSDGDVERVAGLVRAALPGR